MSKIICPNCFTKNEEGNDRCKECGSLIQENESHQLKVGSLLHERYLVGKVLGQGGFGITYLGKDTTLDRLVAIKEYFPMGFVNRHHTITDNVSVTMKESADFFVEGKEKVLLEARTLAKFSGDPNIVGIWDFFEENNTAYIIMEYLSGMSLAEFLKEHGNLSFDEAYVMLKPVMEALQKVHAEGIIHRDISPSNLMLVGNGHVKILDFGTARITNPRGEGSLSVVLNPGFAPQEQYNSHGMQGPWTDVYELCATMYKLITGITPQNSMSRLFSDEIVLPSEVDAQMTKSQEEVIMKGMAVDPEERYQTMQELINAFEQKEESVPEEPDYDDERTMINPQAYVKKKHVPEKDDIGEKVLTDETIGQTMPMPETVKEKKKKQKPVKERKAIRINWKPVLIGIMGVALVIGIVFGAKAILLDNPYKQSEYSARIKDTEVTEKMLNTINRDEKIYHLTLQNCTVSDAILNKIASMSHITHMQITNCTGIKNYDPLASMTNLEILELEGNSQNHVALDSSSFNKEFPYLKDIRLYQADIDGDGSFLGQFSHLNRLILSGCEGAIDTSYLSGNADLKYVSLNDVTVKNHDFSGFSTCTGIEEIRMNEMEMEDLSWAEPLLNLRFLYLAGNHLKSLPLANHASLITIEAPNNEIEDISGLEGCTALQELVLYDNQITDISSLSSCESLKDVNFNNNQIEDITALSSLTTLKNVLMENNHISDVSPMADHDTIIVLDFNKNPISDISDLSGCTGLEGLYLSDTDIDNLDACINMIDLTRIYAHRAQLTDISGLKNTTMLEQAGFQDNSISDISALSANSKLEVLRMSYNQIADLSPLKNLAQLKLVSLNNNRISDITPLNINTDMQYLAVGNNQIKDISCLASMTSLAYIDVGDNQITDLSPAIHAYPTSQILLAHNNQISTIPVLPSEVEYYFLTLYGNQIKDMAPIEDLVNENQLQDELYISWYENIDYIPVAKTKFSKVSLIDTPMDKRAVLKELDKNTKNEEKIYMSNEMEFPSAEEADANVNEFRLAVRDKESDYSKGLNMYNLYNSVIGGE